MKNYLSQQYIAGQTGDSCPNADCGWGATLSAISKNLATYFERLSEYQLEASNELSRLATDPSRAPEAYATYMSRLMQMQSELQAAMQKNMVDAQQLYENSRRSVEVQLAAPGNGGLGGVVAPGMKYGQPGSRNPGGPGDWSFDPVQGLPLMDSSLSLPSLATPAPAPASTMLPWSSIPAFPMMPVFSPTLSSASAGLPLDDTIDKDVLSARAELRGSVLPPAPQLGYTMPRTDATATSGIKYRCDGYRRVARAKP
jgi:hypothetical protein